MPMSLGTFTSKVNFSDAPLDMAIEHDTPYSKRKFREITEGGLPTTQATSPSTTVATPIMTPGGAISVVGVTPTSSITSISTKPPVVPLLPPAPQPSSPAQIPWSLIIPGVIIIIAGAVLSFYLFSGKKIEIPV
jgi:hypothetical protein